MALGEVSRLTAGFTTVYGPHMVELLDVPEESVLINGNPVVEECLSDDGDCSCCCR